MSSQLYFALHRSWLLIGQDSLPVLWLVAQEGAVVTAAAAEIFRHRHRIPRPPDSKPTIQQILTFQSWAVVDIKMPDKNIESLLSAALSKVETREQLMSTYWSTSFCQKRWSIDIQTSQNETFSLSSTTTGSNHQPHKNSPTPGFPLQSIAQFTFTDKSCFVWFADFQRVDSEAGQIHI